MHCTYQEFLREPVDFVEAVLHWDKVARDRAAKEAERAARNRQ